MVHTRPTFRTIFAINWRFLWACFWGWLAFATWPSDTNLAQHFDFPALWGFYAFSILCGLICWGLIRSNISRIAASFERDHEVANFNEHGAAPHSDRMASRHDLKSGGLIR